ncbi:MAG: DUF1565 domain-containing protein [Planctomycetes bacterium]|nr:DUF1565 domain-containing protein [Planctomycetota bacterium]
MPNPASPRAAPFCAAACTGLLLASSPAARATDWYVDASANCGAGNGSALTPYCTVAEAVAVAAVDDTIHVAPGSYVAAISFYGEQLHFVADQGAAVTSLYSTAGRPITLNSGTIVDFTGFTIANNASVIGGAVTVVGSNATSTTASSRTTSRPMAAREAAARSTSRHRR